MTAVDTPPRVAPVPPARAEGRMALLDLVRLGAALCVVLYHFLAGPTVQSYWDEAPSGTTAALRDVSRYGWLGVEVFFVISGLVIARSARRATLARFVASRVGRLYPGYWAAVLLTVVLITVWDGARYSDPVGAVVNLTMVQGAFGVPSVQVAFWTLLVELKFYALVAVVVACGGFAPRRILWVSVLWPTLSTAVWVVQRHGSPGGALADVVRLLCDGFVPRYAPFFAIGMLVYLWRECHRSPLYWVGVATSAPLALHGLLLGAEEASALQGVTLSPVVVVTVFVAGLALVVWAAVARFGSRTAHVMAVAGALTYPLYLVHGEVGYATIDVLSGRWPVPVTLLVAVAVSVAVAVALYVGVERRGGPALRSAVLRALGAGSRREEPTQGEVSAAGGRGPRPASAARAGVARADASGDGARGAAVGDSSPPVARPPVRRAG